MWNQYDTVYYFNSNAKQGELGEDFVDASAGFPSPLPFDFQYNTYLFPAAYVGCQCNTLIGDDNVNDYPNTIEVGQGNLILAIGTFKAPLITLYTSYEFNFTVPDQTGYTTPNELKFAVYTNATSPVLVAQSKTVIVQSVSGPQNFLVKLQGNLTGILIPGRQYLLGQQPTQQRLSLTLSALETASCCRLTCCLPSVG